MTDVDSRYIPDTNTNPGQLSATFMGVFMSQIWLDLMLWERFLNLHNVECCIELGTGCGGFSTYLALQCYQRGIEFHTFDNQDKFFNVDAPVPSLLSNVHFYHVDIKQDALPMIASIVARVDIHPIVLFCDNGDKPLEWKLFAPLLSAGDYIAVHDWDYEFTPDDIGNIAVQMLEGELCTKLGSVTRWFRVLGND